MATETAINVYGLPPLTPKEMIQRMEDKRLGIVRYHETTYLEYEIPKALEKELSKMIEKRIEEFEKECQCEDCKENRNK